jgi:hypothetical protein
MFTTSTASDVYGAYGGPNHTIDTSTPQAQHNLGPDRLLAKYRASITAGRSGAKARARIDARSQAFLERAAARIEAGKGGALKRFAKWNSIRQAVGLSPLALSGGILPTAITNPRLWRKSKEVKKKLRKARRKNMRARVRKRTRKRIRARSQEQAPVAEAEGAPGKTWTPSTQQETLQKVSARYERQLATATADQAADAELSGILGFGVDTAGQGRTNALHILDLGLAGIVTDEDYGDYKDRFARRKKRISARKKRADKRGKRIAGRKAGRADVQKSRKALRQKRLANIKSVFSRK